MLKTKFKPINHNPNYSMFQILGFFTNQGYQVYFENNEFILLKEVQI